MTSPPARAEAEAAHERWEGRRDQIRRAHAGSPVLAIPAATVQRHAVNEGHESMLDEARRAQSAALADCQDALRVPEPDGKEHTMVKGVIMVRARVIGAPDIGTIFENVEVLQNEHTDPELLECMTAAMYDFVGTAPPENFETTITRTTLGRPPPDTDDAGWRQRMFDAVVSAHLSEVRACEPAGSPMRPGTLTLALEFENGPDPVDARIARSTVPEDVAECIVASSVLWKFPRKFAGRTMQLELELPIDPAVDGLERE